MGKARELVLGCVAVVLVACGGAERHADDDDGSSGGGGTTSASSSVDTGVGVGSGGSGCGTSIGTTLTEVGDNPETVQIEADGTHVFWSDTYGLHRSLPDGSEVVGLLQGIPFSANDLLVTSSGIYLTGYSGISKLDKDGNTLGANTTLMSVGTVAEDGAAVFFTRANEGAVYTAPSDPVGGGGASVLAGTAAIPPHAGGIMARDGFVFWSSGSVLYRAPESGGSVDELSGDASPKIWNGSVALTAELVVWIGQDGIHAAPIAGGASFLVSTIAPGNWRLTADEESVYFAAGNAIYRADFAGGDAVMLDCYGDVTGPDVAVDGNNVYWLGGTTAQGPGDFNTYTLRATPKN